MLFTLLSGTPAPHASFHQTGHQVPNQQEKDIQAYIEGTSISETTSEKDIPLSTDMCSVAPDSRMKMARLERKKPMTISVTARPTETFIISPAMTTSRTNSSGYQC
ncbi:hypothetical protein [Rossellomorea marisflavi]|uniref:hypothetical protein n=1 Tax=Rossellomorea marisflavi TaxID=189381 RepID=UPI00128EB115|nr:hypothetical protein [Rossellomorea marisflavi]